MPASQIILGARANRFHTRRHILLQVAGRKYVTPLQQKCDESFPLSGTENNPTPAYKIQGEIASDVCGDNRDDLIDQMAIDLEERACADLIFAASRFDIGSPSRRPPRAGFNSCGASSSSRRREEKK